MKLAQVECNGGEYRLGARWVIGDEESPLFNRESLVHGLGDKVRFIKAVRTMFRGRASAASLPMSCVKMRMLELPTVSYQELQQLAEQELAGEVESDQETFECGAWQASAAGAVSQVIAIAADHKVSTSVGRGPFRSWVRLCRPGRRALCHRQGGHPRRS